VNVTDFNEAIPSDHGGQENGPIVGILADLIRELGEARERAARAEMRSEFLDDQVSSLKAERNLLRGRLIQARIEANQLPPGVTETDVEALALESDEVVPPAPAPTAAAERPVASPPPVRRAGTDGGSSARPPAPPRARPEAADPPSRTPSPANVTAAPSNVSAPPADLWSSSAPARALTEPPVASPTKPAKRRRWWSRSG
jgi:hypothetical protein